ncbi:hypothetical protein B0H16DRAFT_1701768 [Mycena metata]|uniref:Uncharacterized protein n=1 Tax=Mycena metata TaxID=1033252 RepID=A0AAD7MFH2_9AGAR|nr:hypothetical protein B0H16DRAFT_1701768 [Mycena metata]
MSPLYTDRHTDETAYYRRRGIILLATRIPNLRVGPPAAHVGRLGGSSGGHRVGRLWSLDRVGGVRPVRARTMLSGETRNTSHRPVPTEKLYENVETTSCVQTWKMDPPLPTTIDRPRIRPLRAKRRLILKKMDGLASADRKCPYLWLENVLGLLVFNLNTRLSLPIQAFRGSNWDQIIGCERPTGLIVRKQHTGFWGSLFFGSSYTTKVPSRREQMAPPPRRHLKRQVSALGSYLAASCSRQLGLQLPTNQSPLWRFSMLTPVEQVETQRYFALSPLLDSDLKNQLLASTATFNSTIIVTGVTCMLVASQLSLSPDSTVSVACIPSSSSVILPCLFLFKPSSPSSERALSEPKLGRATLDGHAIGGLECSLLTQTNAHTNQRTMSLGLSPPIHQRLNRGPVRAYTLIPLQSLTRGRGLVFELRGRRAGCCHVMDRPSLPPREALLLTPIYTNS